MASHRDCQVELRKLQMQVELQVELVGSAACWVDCSTAHAKMSYAQLSQGEDVCSDLLVMPFPHFLAHG